MNRYKKSRLVVVVSLLVLLALSLLFLTVSKDRSIPQVEEGVAKVISSLHRFTATPMRFLSKKQLTLEELLMTYQENQELKETLARLENAEVERDALKDENASLRESLAIQGTYGDKVLYPSLVLTRVPATWTDQLIIHLGQVDGVTKDMLVMANGGLVGRIEEVEETSSVVKLLSNADEFTKIPVKIQTSSGAIYGILSGYDMDTQAFLVDQLNSTEAIPASSKVVTSDLAGRTPSNLAIGEVLSVETSSSNLNRTLYVKPAADFSNLYSVVVVGENR